MKRISTFTLVMVFAFGAAHTIFADPLQWDLSTLTLSAVVSTGTMTGSFTYDADTNRFTTWSFALSGFPGTGVPASGLLLTPADTSTCPTSPLNQCYPNEIVLLPTVSEPFRGLDLFFTQPLTDAGGTVPLSTGLGVGLYLDNPSFGTFELQGPASISAVPEPSSAALILVVAIGFGTLFLRRLRHTRPNQWR